MDKGGIIWDSRTLKAKYYGTNFQAGKVIKNDSA